LKMKANVLTLAFAVALIASAHAADWSLSPQGYGPVRIGMSPGEASSALGTPLEYEGEGQADPACHHLSATARDDHLRYMVQAGRIVRISLYEGPSPVRADKGIALGDPARKVRQAYGEEALDIAPHEYVNGEYLTFWNEKEKRGIRYETKTDDPAPFLDPGDALVYRIHVGGEAVNLIEGCS